MKPTSAKLSLLPSIAIAPTPPLRKALHVLVSALLLGAVSVPAMAATPAIIEKAEPIPAVSPANSDLVNRGAYIARAADCMACHRENYAGGVGIETPMGKVYATNITPSVRYGIGNYTEQDLKNALKKGRAPDHQLYPAMPYPSYSGMTDEDIYALFAYLQTVPAVDEASPHKTELPFPFNIRTLMKFWNVINVPAWEARTDLDATQQRGEYLVNNLEHCATCHTPRDSTMGYNKSLYMAGAQLGNWHAPNITPDEASGIGSWSETDIATYLRTGHLENRAFAGGPMGEAVAHSTRYLTTEDLRAIASYLKVIPAVRTEDTLQPLNTAKLPQKANDEITFNLLDQMKHIEQAKLKAGAAAGGTVAATSEALYLAKCASCHGVDGYGQPEARYAPIVGISTLRRDQPNAVVNVIAHGIEGATNTSPQMPGFKDELSAEQIAGLANYVRVTFGGMSDSQVTAEQVDNIMTAPADVPFLIKNAGWLAWLGIIAVVLLLGLLIWCLLRRMGDAR